MSGFVRLTCTKCGAKQNRALPYSMAASDFCIECGKPLGDPLPSRPPTCLQSQATLIATLVEALGKVLAAIDAQDAAYLGESIHAGFRKGSEAPDSAALWKAIADSKTSAWVDAIEYHLGCVDFHFGDDIRAARKAHEAATKGSSND